MKNSNLLIAALLTTCLGVSCLDSGRAAPVANDSTDFGETPTAVGGSSSPDGGEAESRVRIIRPKDGDRVPEIMVVKVMAPHSARNVWVIVHPLDQQDGYYVQHPPKKGKGGVWRCEGVHIGRSGDVDAGKQFALMAVIDEELKPGQRLAGWPDVPEANQSPIIDIERK